MIRPDVLEALQNSVSSSSKLFVLTFTEKNGKAWAMVKTKAKTRAMPKKRRLYEVAGAEDDLLPSSKKRARLDQKEEEKEGAGQGYLMSKSQINSQAFPSNIRLDGLQPNQQMMMTPTKRKDASTHSPDRDYEI
jgi:hypothetical protein